MSDEGKVCDEWVFKFAEDFASVLINLLVKFLKFFFSSCGFCVSLSKTVQLIFQRLDLPGLLLFNRPQGLNLFLKSVFLFTKEIDLFILVFMSFLFDLLGLEFSFVSFIKFLNLFLLMFELIFQVVNFLFELFDFGLETFLLVKEDG